MLVAVKGISLCVLALTANGKLRTSCNELQEVSPLGGRELTHRLEQVAHTLTVHIKAVVCFDRIEKS